MRFNKQTPSVLSTVACAFLLTSCAQTPPTTESNAPSANTPSADASLRAAAADTLPPTRPNETLVPEFDADLPAGELCESDMWNEVHSAGSDDLAVDCSLSLAPTTTITRHLVYRGSAASGATLFCQCDGDKCTTFTGGITIATVGDDDWPHDITVRNCRITDSNVRVENFSSNESTRREDFVAWIRARAPKRITFDNIKIDGVEKDRFYVGWGAIDVKLINSSVSGRSWGVPVYLGPQTSGTLLKGNRFETITYKATGWRHVPLLGYVFGAIADSYAREMVTIDSSDNNRIISNWFGGKLSHGGIYLFRNCGEKGAIRHTTPSRNQIINNAFRYRNYNGSSPAIFLGSRNGTSPSDYCDLDDGYDVGSSKDDRDFATHNVVMQNEIIDRPLSGAIRSLNWVNNAMNLVDYNRKVGGADWPRPPAGCYVKGGAKDFILHGETTERFMDDGGAPICESVKCSDGELQSNFVAPQDGVVAPATNPQGAAGMLDVVAPFGTVVETKPEGPASVCATKRVPIDCQISGDNDGCKQTVSCPAGTTVVGAFAACNLESGTVSDADLAAMPAHLIHVAKLSDHVPSGLCWVEHNRVVGKLDYSPNYGSSFRSPPPRDFIPSSAVQAHIRGVAGLSQVEAGCKEYDGNNGGDCHIRGSLYCH
jgi:hypothetical protein